MRRHSTRCGLRRGLRRGAAGRSYSGASSAERTDRNIGDDLSVPSRAPAPVVGDLPITTACRSHFSKTACSSASRPRSATISIRSCDSESRISYGVRFASRSGTWSRSSSIPSPPRAAISLDDEVSPAAPMSWIATIAPVFIASRHASISNFSVNGSPTCTVGRLASLSASNSAEASRLAPWMPSRPVAEPT